MMLLLITVEGCLTARKAGHVARLQGPFMARLVPLRRTFEPAAPAPVLTRAVAGRRQTLVHGL